MLPGRGEIVHLYWITYTVLSFTFMYLTLSSLKSQIHVLTNLRLLTPCFSFLLIYSFFSCIFFLTYIHILCIYFFLIHLFFSWIFLSFFMYSFWFLCIFSSANCHTSIFFIHLFFLIYLFSHYIFILFHIYIFVFMQLFFPFTSSHNFFSHELVLVKTWTLHLLI